MRLTFEIEEKPEGGFEIFRDGKSVKCVTHVSEAARFLSDSVYAKFPEDVADEDEPMTMPTLLSDDRPSRLTQFRTMVGGKL